MQQPCKNGRQSQLRHFFEGFLFFSMATAERSQWHGPTCFSIFFFYVFILLLLLWPRVHGVFVFGGATLLRHDLHHSLALSFSLLPLHCGVCVCILSHESHVYTHTKTQGYVKRRHSIAPPPSPVTTHRYSTSSFTYFIISYVHLLDNKEDMMMQFNANIGRAQYHTHW